MTYSFACPVPCNYEIRVDAKNGDDAIKKIIMVDAIHCRNINNRCHCERANHNMPPIKEEQLRNIVRLCMEEKCDISNYIYKQKADKCSCVVSAIWPDFETCFDPCFTCFTP